MPTEPSDDFDTIHRRPASGAGEARDADDLLPPVEPPSAAFLVQLFLVPGIIVSIIVGVWLAFHWLAHLGSDPQALVRTLRRDNEGRWQAALNLANDLRGPGGAALKSDDELAAQLGQILDDEVRSGRTGEHSQTLRIYLCRALGEFATPSAAAPLVRRGTDTADPQTARAAVEALAVLTTNLTAAGRSHSDPKQVLEAVLEASRSEDPLVRSAAAFTLGVIGGGEAADRLAELASGGSDDPRAADIRFNAATALARLGRDEAYEPLAEMLSLPDEPAGPEDATREPDAAAQSRRYKRALVVVNGLRGVALLVDSTDSRPPERIVELVEKLEHDPVADVRSSAAALSTKLRRLTQRGTPRALRGARRCRPRLR